MKFVVLIIVSISLFACSDKENQVPDVPVNFRASLNDPRISALNGAGGAVSISGYGVAGIIIYRRADNAYVAYDRCSTVNPEQKCAVTIDNPNLTVTDACSGAKYSLYDGAPVKAPAKRGLKQYQVNVSSVEISVIN